jgi:hypothetical protein
VQTDLPLRRPAPSRPPLGDRTEHRAFRNAGGFEPRLDGFDGAGFPGAADDGDHVPMTFLVGFRAADGGPQAFVSFGKVSQRLELDRTICRGEAQKANASGLLSPMAGSPGRRPKFQEATLLLTCSPAAWRSTDICRHQKVAPPPNKRVDDRSNNGLAEMRVPVTEPPLALGLALHDRRCQRFGQVLAPTPVRPNSPEFGFPVGVDVGVRLTALINIVSNINTLTGLFGGPRLHHNRKVFTRAPALSRRPTLLARKAKRTLGRQIPLRPALGGSGGSRIHRLSLRRLSHALVHELRFGEHRKAPPDPQ